MFSHPLRPFEVLGVGIDGLQQALSGAPPSALRRHLSAIRQFLYIVYQAVELPLTLYLLLAP